MQQREKEKNDLQQAYNSLVIDIQKHKNISLINQKQM
jgi:hypothetical protein